MTGTTGGRVCLLLISFVVLCQQYTALKVFSPCTSNTDCPSAASCTYRGCDGRICLCADGRLPTNNDNECVPATLLGDPCQGNAPCLGPNSHCQDGICQCLHGYQLVHSAVGKWCKQTFFGQLTNAAHGETCGNSTVCSQTFLTCGRDGKCVCKDRYRLATASEINADPYKTEQCRPVGFQIGKPVNVTGPDCPAKVTTRTTTSSTTSTTTTAVPTTTTTTPTSTKPPTTTTTTLTTTVTTPTTPPTTTTPTTTPTTGPTTTRSTSATTTRPITTTTTSTTTATTTQPPTPSTASTKPGTPSTSPTVASTKPTSTTATTLITNITSTTTTVKTSTTQSASNTTETTRESTTGTSESSPSHSFTSGELTTPVSSSPTASQFANKSSSPPLVTSSTGGSPRTPTQTRDHTSTSPLSLNYSTNTASPRSTTAPLTGSSTAPTGGTTPCASQQQPAGLGGHCTPCSCPGNASCEEDMCYVPRCRCDLGYADSPDTTQCWKLSALGESCSSQRLCQGPFSVCSEGGVCECQDEYERSDTGRWCRLSQSWFVKFPVLGEKCTSSFTAECYFGFEQECEDGRCTCKAGLHDVTDVDKQAVYPDLVQCRNSSYGNGYREKDICENMSRTKFGVDLYDNAKDKIRKMQGAIIGGCIGGVAFIGLVIGGVAIIRWKRRGRRETIRDTSSTASTEGQRSRYSFKIPRPFAHFILAKDYDSNPITYPNSVYDGEHDGQSVSPQPDIVATNNVHDNLYHVDNGHAQGNT